MNLTLAHDVLFDTDEPTTGDPLLGTATAFATRPTDTPGELVVVVRPGTDECVVAGGSQSVLRAAVSVAAATDDAPLWRSAPAGDTVDIPTRSLPDRVGTAAAAAGAHTVHAGRVELGGTDHAVAIWFETSSGVADADQRRFVLTALADAASRSETQRREAAMAAAAAAAAAPRTPTPPTGRQFDASDPDLDPISGLLAPHRFRADAFDLFCDEAGVVVVDIGDGTAGDEAVRTFADRLVDAFGRNDLLGRLSAGRFAVVSPDAERSAVIGGARTLLDSLAGSDAPVIATIAAAHEVGLVDIEELLEIAGAAATEGRDPGESKLVLAS